MKQINFSKMMFIIFLATAVIAFAGCGTPGDSVSLDGNDRDDDGDGPGPGNGRDDDEDGFIDEDDENIDEDIINENVDEDITSDTVTRRRVRYDFSRAAVLLSPSATTEESAPGAALVRNTGITEIITTVLDKLTDEGFIESAITIVEEEVPVPDCDESVETEDQPPEDQPLTAVLIGRHTIVAETADEASVECEDNPVEDTFNLNVPAVSAVVQSPAGEIYILYQSRFLFDGFTSCQLFKYLPESQGVECVDSEVYGVGADNLQFDSSGNLFYLGNLWNSGHYIAILRRKMRDTGEISNITNQYISAYHFVPLNDGSVVVYGRTESTSSTNFIRRYTTANSVENLWGASEIYTNRMWRSSEGKVYISGSWRPSSGSYEAGILRVALTEAGSVEVTPIMVNTNIDSDVNYEGSNVRAFYETLDGQIFFIEENSVFRLSPVPALLYSITTIPLGIADGNHLYLAGTDGSAQVFRSYTLTGDEAGRVDDLLSATDDNIEMYEFDADSEGRIYFTGLRFSDNQVVVGMIDMNNANEITYNIELEEQPDVFEILR